MSNDLPDGSRVDATDDTESAVTRELGDAAERVDVGDPAVMLTEVRSISKRRRRRRSVVMGVAAAGALVASGVVVANLIGTGGDERIVTSSDSDPRTTDGSTTTEATAGTLPDEAPSPPDAVPVRLVAATGQQVPEPGFTSDGEQQPGSTQVVAWKDGFLAVHTDYGPQRLPAELPPEVTAEFPPEVVDLFAADGLPPTVDEAMAMLDEAGLLDEVTQLVTDDPELYDAIYSEGSDTTTTARFSTDGIEWTDVDVAFPDVVDQGNGLKSTGDRVAMVVSDGVVPGGDGPQSIDVVSSTDLVDWTTQTIALPARPADLPEYVDFDSSADTLVVNADGWLLSVRQNPDVDVVSLLPDDLRARVEAGNGFGTGWDDDGVSIDLFSDEDVENAVGDVGPSETIRVTWDELGVDPPTSALRDINTSSTWSSSWEGDRSRSAPARSDSDFGYGTVGVDGFFVTPAAGGVAFSADGVEWTFVDPPVPGNVSAVMPVGSSVVAFVEGDSGDRSQDLFDPTDSTWQALDIDGLPERFSAGQSFDGAAVLDDFGSEVPEVGGSVRATAETDAYRFELTHGGELGPASVSYVLTDLTTGDVVSSESLDLDGSGNGAFEFAREVYDIDGGQEGFRLLDPETGDELVAIPFDDMTYVRLDADGQPIDEPVADASITESDGASGPRTSWILATDGTTWVIDDITGSSDAFDLASVVVNNGIVIAATYDDRLLRYELG